MIAKQPSTMEKTKNKLNKNIITIIYNNHDIFPYQRINYHPNLPITDVLQLCLSVVMEIYRNSLDKFPFTYTQPNIKPCGLFAVAVIWSRNDLLPPASEEWRKVMFSLCSPVRGGGGGTTIQLMGGGVPFPGPGGGVPLPRVGAGGNPHNPGQIPGLGGGVPLTRAA